ncbi:MAG TPA: carboxypeptidase regulatory-like domain-containing protein [Vicinamibacteria bacterium]|jgi:plastocyanin|nr:carboxypeptidase regulatory-like domain-containing protein [Vicinamibacteria bacterium]
MAALLSLAAALPASAAAIRGTVDVKRPLPALERRPDVSEIGVPAPRALTDRRRAVVYLETAPRGAFETREGARAVIDQRDETFLPHVLAVTAGTTVVFTNSDRTYHNVFSLSKDNRFDLGRYGRGHSKSVRFEHPGVVRVFCDIHSHMSAFILVFAHRYFAVTDAEGRYRIDDVPPGTYTVVAWNEGQPRESRSVRVGEEGVEADFVLR